MQISVTIGSFNRHSLLMLCIEAVRRELSQIAHEIIVVDGGSTDGSVEWISKQKDIILILQHNRGIWNGKPIRRRPWSYFMNLAFKAAQGKYICMLSDDSLIVPDCILEGYKYFERRLNEGKDLGALAFYFRDYPIRKKYAVAVNIGNLYVNHGLFLRHALEEVGYCDEEYHFYFADTDLTLKLKQKGYLVDASAKSFVEHYFEATPEIRASNTDSKKENDRLRLIEKWAGKAFAVADKAKYLKCVGYWDYHPVGLKDRHDTIQRLVKASMTTFSLSAKKESPHIESSAAAQSLVYAGDYSVSTFKPMSSAKFVGIGVDKESRVDISARSLLDYKDWQRILLADHYWIHNAVQSQKINAVKKWLRIIRHFSLTFIPKRYDAVFIRSMQRTDYKEMFRDIIRASLLSNIAVIEDYDSRLEYGDLNLEAIKIFESNKDMLAGITYENKTDQLYCYIKAIYYLLFIDKLRELEFPLLVFHADMQPLEHALSLYFGRQGVETVSMQHGLYVEYNNLDTVNKINYLHHPSKYLLAWGNNTARLISSYHCNSRIFVCGKPSVFNCVQLLGQIGNRHIKRVLLILDQKCFSEQNTEMATIVKEYCERHGLQMYARLHPSLNRAAFLQAFPGVQDSLSLQQADIIIGHTSSLLYEAFSMGLLVMRFSTSVPSIEFPHDLCFANFKELERRIADFHDQGRNLASKVGQHEYVGAFGEESRVLYSGFFAQFEAVRHGDAT